MDPTISVSKGCFVFKNGATKSGKRLKRTKQSGTKLVPLLSEETTNQLFYRMFTKTWGNIKDDIEAIQMKCQSKVIEDLTKFVKNAYRRNDDNILPTAVLLTGINQPDHGQQFKTISETIENQIPACVSVIYARDSSNLKNAIETMVYEFVVAPYEIDEDTNGHKPLRKSQCTIQVLQAWYETEFPDRHRTLAVILPDFECFVIDVLQDFILILSSLCKNIPIVLILGVATATSALHSTLPYNVTSKIRLQIFQTQPAPAGLTQIIESVILSPKYAFHLSGKSFKFLTDIFLFYDFSINGFVQGFKYCLMQHFFQGNAFALCTNYKESLEIVKHLTHSDIECIRHLLSFRPYVESMNGRQKIFAILTEDDYFKRKLPKLLKQCHIYFTNFHCFLEFLSVLVVDLPKSPLGRQRRELYSALVSSAITEQTEFKECWHMLSFLSKEEFIAKITRAINTTAEYMKINLHNDDISEYCKKIVLKKLECIKDLLSKVATAGLEATGKHIISQTELNNLNRQEIQEKLLQMSKEVKRESDFTKSINSTMEYIKNEIVLKYLLPLQQNTAPPLYELFVFSDISSIRRHIVGAPRAALHTALNNPHAYLQCNCCELDRSESIMQTLPDVSVAYKLHLECGRMINLYDWLQAFKSVVNGVQDDHEQVDPKIQARFTRAVSELQFLGYIKTSKRKTDHVTRLTW